MKLAEKKLLIFVLCVQMGEIYLSLSNFTAKMSLVRHLRVYIYIPTAANYALTNLLLSNKKKNEIFRNL